MAASAGLTVLGQTTRIGGDYLLLKAQILDAAGQGGEAEKVLEQGSRLSISRPQIARRAALLLVRHDRKEMALDLISKAAGNDPDLLLTLALRCAVARLAASASADPQCSCVSGLYELFLPRCAQP